MSNDMAEPILKVEGLNKSFGAVHVLHDVDFTVYPGEVTALVGDNGAERVKLAVGPGVNAEVDVLDADALRRASINSGGHRLGNDPDSAGFNAFARTA